MVIGHLVELEKRKSRDHEQITSEPEGVLHSHDSVAQAFSAYAVLRGIYNRTLGAFFSNLATSSPRSAHVCSRRGTQTGSNSNFKHRTLIAGPIAPARQHLLDREADSGDHTSDPQSDFGQPSGGSSQSLLSYSSLYFSPASRARTMSPQVLQPRNCAPSRTPLRRTRNRWTTR